MAAAAARSFRRSRGTEKSFSFVRDHEQPIFNSSGSKARPSNYFSWVRVSHGIRFLWAVGDGCTFAFWSAAKTPRVLCDVLRQRLGIVGIDALGY